MVVCVANYSVSHLFFFSFVQLFQSELTDPDLEEDMGQPGEVNFHSYIFWHFRVSLSSSAVTGASSISISRAIVRTNSTVMVR